MEPVRFRPAQAHGVKVSFGIFFKFTLKNFFILFIFTLPFLLFVSLCGGSENFDSGLNSISVATFDSHKMFPFSI